MDDNEVAGHQAEALLVLGDADAALERLQQCVRTVGTQRGEAFYRVQLVRGWASARAWRECEEALLEVPPLLAQVASGRIRRRLAEALRQIRRDRQAPGWVRDTAADVAGDLGIVTGHHYRSPGATS
ncbi:hypothetical protein [Marinitenerispora sediminis]|uniref:Tetratricopeptide repeat protein n=1 Tax=Marinitenerispora sediminis TaxID=1931232 RepID=A0A368T3V3_9ACTN|nr:hypothetical protein [Marinitenerispora sediminis]RCV49743.1 hypothetical protein DEF28_19955 [Marinitenerispora sediminis]RCV53557.1 hypothetical protein DEF23_17305 [Marinitenerispora sediminis]RCV57655.1 hypothetical protein DEF24_14865 [Marinitenerispora sediminis]